MTAGAPANTTPHERVFPKTGRLERPDLVALGKRRLGPTELRQIRFIRSTFELGTQDRILRWLQLHIGTLWIYQCTKNLVRLHGLENIPKLPKEQSVFFVANHRSFFDLYVITAYLMKEARLRQRIVFPVRANFFYDSYAGLFVNGIMSFFAMYPPIFREKSKAALNVAALKELAWLIRRGQTFVGMHPEGTRGTGPDPYSLLPAQPGVGKVIYETQTVVIPIFINGLINDLKQQVLSNFDGTGRPIHVVFGPPLDLSEFFAQSPSPKLFKAISQRCIDVISELGQEEKRLRASE